MTYAQIVSAVKKLKKKYGTSDPYELCNCLNIKIIQGHHGTGEGSLKGFFMEHCRIRIITVNADLPKIFQRIIIAHELGHAVLHKAEGVRTFQDVTMFDSSSKCEKEAKKQCCKATCEMTSPHCAKCGTAEQQCGDCKDCAKK